MGERFFIIEEGEVLPEWADSCVVRLVNAEQKGVPLPPYLAPMVADVIDAGGKDKGASPAGQPL